MKLQYGGGESKEATAVGDCIPVMGTEHGRGYGAMEAAETEMLPGACAKGSGIKPVTGPVRIVQGCRASRPPHSLTLPDIQ